MFHRENSALFGLGYPQPWVKPRLDVSVGPWKVRDLPDNRRHSNGTKDKLMRRIGSMKTNLIQWFSIVVLGFVCASSALAQSSPVKVDSEAISGLGARNIGSAAMSGRVTSL